MTVVSDSSPLISLARVGRLNLLSDLFGRILIPPEVQEEVTVTGFGLPGSEEVGQASWIEVRAYPKPKDPVLIDSCEALGAGERGSILLASGVSADLVVLDDRRARRIALRIGLAVVGCVGILEAAAQNGKISDLRATYIQLLSHGIRFDTRLLNESLKRLELPLL